MYALFYFLLLLFVMDLIQLLKDEDNIIYFRIKKNVFK